MSNSKKNQTGIRLLLPALLCGIFPFSLPGKAQGNVSASYLSHPQSKAFIDEIVAENIYPRPALEQLLESASKQQSILDAIARPAEKTKSWAEYRAIFLTQDRIDKGIDFYKQYQSAFAQAEKKYGVPRQIILAIIGVETRYGQHKGNYRVIDSLATLAFDYPPRSPFFREELKQFLKLQAEAGINLSKVKGSYAGAMGYGQFISSSYRHYAVDFNNDGRIDLINTPEDAIGSVANYFKEHGWQNGAPITSVARYLQPSNDKQNALSDVINRDLKPQYTVAELRQRGLLADTDLDQQQKATAMQLNGSNGVEYWIGLQNFYVITRYNHSHLYAMAVFQLSEELKKRLNS